MNGEILPDIRPFMRGMPHVNVASLPVNFNIPYADPVRDDPAEVNPQPLADFFIELMGVAENPNSRPE
jgi:hypothetical protein